METSDWTSGGAQSSANSFLQRRVCHAAEEVFELVNSAEASGAPYLVDCDVQNILSNLQPVRLAEASGTGGSSSSPPARRGDSDVGGSPNTSAGAHRKTSTSPSGGSRSHSGSSGSPRDLSPPMLQELAANRIAVAKHQKATGVEVLSLLISCAFLKERISSVARDSGGRVAATRDARRTARRSVSPHCSHTYSPRSNRARRPPESERERPRHRSTPSSSRTARRSISPHCSHTYSPRSNRARRPPESERERPRHRSTPSSSRMARRSVSPHRSHTYSPRSDRARRPLERERERPRRHSSLSSSSSASGGRCRSRASSSASSRGEANDAATALCSRVISLLDGDLAHSVVAALSKVMTEKPRDNAGALSQASTDAESRIFRVLNEAMADARRRRADSATAASHPFVGLLTGECPATRVGLAEAAMLLCRRLSDEVAEIAGAVRKALGRLLESGIDAEEESWDLFDELRTQFEETAKQIDQVEGELSNSVWPFYSDELSRLKSMFDASAGLVSAMKRGHPSTFATASMSTIPADYAPFFLLPDQKTQTEAYSLLMTDLYVRNGFADEMLLLVARERLLAKPTQPKQRVDSCLLTLVEALIPSLCLRMTATYPDWTWKKMGNDWHLTALSYLTGENVTSAAKGRCNESEAFNKSLTLLKHLFEQTSLPVRVVRSITGFRMSSEVPCHSPCTVIKLANRRLVISCARWSHIIHRHVGFASKRRTKGRHSALLRAQDPVLRCQRNIIEGVFYDRTHKGVAQDVALSALQDVLVQQGNDLEVETMIETKILTASCCATEFGADACCWPTNRFKLVYMPVYAGWKRCDCAVPADMLAEAAGAKLVPTMSASDELGAVKPKDAYLITCYPC